MEKEMIKGTAYLVFNSEGEPDPAFIKQAARRIADFLTEDVDAGEQIRWMTGEQEKPGVWRYGYICFGDEHRRGGEPCNLKPVDGDIVEELFINQREDENGVSESQNT